MSELFDRRAWVHTKLSEDSEMGSFVADRIYSNLSEDANIERPFVVIRFDSTIRDVGDLQDLTIWVHDNPGSYKRIDSILEIVRKVLSGPVATTGGIGIDWQGDSADLTDDGRGTLVKFSSFRIAGRRVA